MIICQPGAEQQFAEALDASRELTAEQIEALVTELRDDPQDRGYADPIKSQEWKRVRGLLLNHYTAPQPAQVVMKSVVTGPEIKNWIAPILVSVITLAPEGAVKTKWQDILKAWSGVDASYSFDPATSTKWMGLKATVGELTDGSGGRIITAADISNLESIHIPAQRVPTTPRSWSVLGQGFVIEVSDLAQLHAEGLI